MVLTYAGTASLQCTSQFKVTAPNIQPDSINVTVNPYRHHGQCLDGGKRVTDRGEW